MYWVYAETLKQLHNYKDKNPGNNKMPYFELEKMNEWKNLINLFADNQKVLLISIKQPINDIIMLDKFDEVVLFPLGHYSEKIVY